MGLTVIAERLGPPAPGNPRTHAVHTRTKIRVPGHQFAQTGAALVRLTVRAAGPDGYALDVETLELRPDPVDLLTDIARCQSPLRVHTDARGALQHVTNKAALTAQWLAALAAKHGVQPGAAAHELAGKARIATVEFVVLGVGLAIAGCFFPPLELGATGAFEAAALAVGTFEAAELTYVVGVAAAWPANVSVVVGDAVGLCRCLC